MRTLCSWIPSLVVCVVLELRVKLFSTGFLMGSQHLALPSLGQHSSKLHCSESLRSVQDTATCKTSDRDCFQHCTCGHIAPVRF